MGFNFAGILPQSLLYGYLLPLVISLFLFVIGYYITNITRHYQGKIYDFL